MKAKFLTLDRTQMIQLVFKMLNVNMSKAWDSYWEDCDCVKHYNYDFSRIRRIGSMVSDWNLDHDYDEEIFFDYDWDDVELLEEVRGVEDYSGEIIRVYIEDDHFTFPA